MCRATFDQIKLVNVSCDAKRQEPNEIWKLQQRAGFSANNDSPAPYTKLWYGVKTREVLVSFRYSLYFHCFSIYEKLFKKINPGEHDCAL